MHTNFVGKNLATDIFATNIVNQKIDNVLQSTLIKD